MNILSTLLIVIALTCVTVAKPLIYLVNSQSLPAYEIAIETIQSELSASYDIKQLFIDRKNVKSVTDAIKKDRPKLTISVGTKATKLLQTKLRRQPILFTMVFRPDRTELVKSLKFPVKSSLFANATA